MLFLVLVLLRLFSCSVAQSCMGTCMWAHPGVPCLRDDSEEYFDELRLNKALHKKYKG